MKLGARILKTGVAIVFAFYLAELLHLPSPIFAGIAAIFAIQPSVYRSYKTIIDQVQGNIIGAVTAVVFVAIFGVEPIVAGFAVIVTLLIMLKLKLTNSVSLALVTVLVIMEGKAYDEFTDFIFFAIIRFATVMVGVIAASIVNLVFLPPKYETRLFASLKYLQDDITRWMRLAVRQASEHTSTKQSVREFRKNQKKLDQVYTLYKEERTYTKKALFMKQRKLVIYRQMLKTTNKSLETLNRLFIHENELANMPERFHIMIQDRLDFLSTYHEQLFLKYTGKLKSHHTTWIGQEEFLQRNEIMGIFADYVIEQHETEGNEEFSSYHLLHILSRILDYEENLEHLDTLISAYQNYHSKELLKERDEDNILT
ncbi:FUSC family protein [Kurthia massiliensis]|uniref:FUSC family protein n=1 Tax=Kurthia massiliensis TaxID=1033739 RepID=UPI000288EB0C|nr:aromatic acid exporter family protein [Kurthia massiliensis]